MNNTNLNPGSIHGLRGAVWQSDIKGKTFKKYGVFQAIHVDQECQLILRVWAGESELSAALEVKQEGSVELMGPWPHAVTWPSSLPVLAWPRHRPQWSSDNQNYCFFSTFVFGYL